jgi:DNA-binding response OmpR family regulator/serine phosphatase RsbU (regulator of sigma subunit)/anti-sigma regulatory factor (Ser/Thr protein kinase)
MLPVQTDSSAKVLIVDDTKTIVQILTMILKKEGFEVFTASSGEEAIELLQNISVDTILLDIQMGKGIDGFETCKILKYNSKTKDIPVIFLTAFDDLETKLRGFEVGGVDFVAKSFDKTEILTRVKNQTKLFKLQNSLKSGLAYIRAILDAQKHFIAIFDSRLNLENYNRSFEQAFDPQPDFRINSKLIQYDGSPSVQNDEMIFELLSKGVDFKSLIKGVDGIYAFELTQAEVLNETKKILTISDITAHETAKRQELELLRYQERYHNTQQQDAFRKQKKIIKDEVSHLFKNGWLFDSYYKPLDILSGDTLGAIKLTEDRYLFYIVDAMGKGLSASVTSIQSTSFINNSIERAIEHSDFSLDAIVRSFCHFIQKQLLEDELLCVAFMDFDIKSESMRIANYGMPPILIEKNNEIESIKPNNPPIMSFLATDAIDEVSLSHISKIAMYSDGLNESPTKEGKPYSKHIEADFKNSVLMRQFLRAFEGKVSKLDDDITLIFISTISSKEDIYSKKIEIDSKLSDVIWLNKEIEQMLDRIEINERDLSEALLVFSELLMNAFEHGALNLSPAEKQRLIEDDSYEEFLAKIDSSRVIKKIEVELTVSKTKIGRLMLEIGIKDPGSGFEFSEALKTIYVEENDKYSGRGVWMANDIMDGIFFSETGNKTTFFKTIRLKK